MITKRGLKAFSSSFFYIKSLKNAENGRSKPKELKLGRKSQSLVENN
jgi:hypothetical protein